MVAENYHFKPAGRAIRGLIDRGDIGAVLFIALNRAQRGRVEGWRREPAMMGGGALLEGGVHWVNLMCTLGGPVREVLAATPLKDYPRVAPREDSVQVLFRFDDGAVGSLLHSWNLANRLAGLQLSRIYGTEGNIHFESNGLFAVAAGRRTRLRVPGVWDLMGYRAMLRHFVACVRDGTAPAAPLAMGVRDLAIVTAAYASLDSGRFERPAAGASESPSGPGHSVSHP